MRVQFVSKENGPERLVCEGELIFDEEGPLAGMKLVGFAVWRSAEGEPYISFPSRAYGSGNDRRFFDYLRPVDGGTTESKRIKAWILEEWQNQSRAA